MFTKLVSPFCTRRSPRAMVRYPPASSPSTHTFKDFFLSFEFFIEDLLWVDLVSFGVLQQMFQTRIHVHHGCRTLVLNIKWLSIIGQQSLWRHQTITTNSSHRSITSWERKKCQPTSELYLWQKPIVDIGNNCTCPAQCETCKRFALHNEHVKVQCTW